MPRVLPAALLAAVLLAGCGQSNPKLIPGDRADQLTAKVDEIQRACDGGDLTAARQATDEARQQVSALPRRVDSRLKRNLRQWINQVENGLGDCKGPEPSASPTPTPSPTATATATPSPPPSPTPSASPTQTPTPSPTPSPDNGGGENAGKGGDGGKGKGNGDGDGGEGRG